MAEILNKQTFLDKDWETGFLGGGGYTLGGPSRRSYRAPLGIGFFKETKD